MYILVGAIRWIDGRPAINSHARTHLGWLLVALALHPDVGLPAGAVRARRRRTTALPDRALWRATTFVAPLLAGVALATALLIAVWAVRGAPLARRGRVDRAAARLARRPLDGAARAGRRGRAGRRAADRGAVRAAGVRPRGLAERAGGQLVPQATPPVVPSLWSRPMAAALLAADSVDIVSLDPALLTVGGRRRPVWLGTRLLPGGRLVVTALADDRTGPAGEALFYRRRTRCRQPSVSPLLRPGDRAPSTAGRPGYRLGRDEEPGVALDSWLARVLLAWALQAPELLGHAGPRCAGRLVADADACGCAGSRRSPVGRAGGARRRRRADLARRRLPAGRGLSARTRDRMAPPPRRRACAAPARHRLGADRRDHDVPAARQRRAGVGAWAAIAAGVIEPTAAMPEAVWRGSALSGGAVSGPGAPAGALLAPARVVGGRSGADGDRVPRADAAWADDTTGPVNVRGVRAAWRAAPERVAHGQPRGGRPTCCGWCDSIRRPRCRPAAGSRVGGRVSRPTTR